MVQEICALTAAFAFIAFAPHKKYGNGPSLLIGALILGVISGHSMSMISENLTTVVTNLRTLKTICLIMQIGILGVLMKHYGLLDNILSSLREIFASSKAIIMLMPSAIGIVSVPGGAGISSPFVDELGKSLNIPVESRAAINLLFRHVALFLLPTSSSMIVLSAAAPDFNLYKLISLNILFVIITELTAYFLFLRNVPDIKTDKKLNPIHGLCGILKYLSPIYMILVLNGIFKIEMYLAGFASLLLILIFWGRHDIATYWKVLCSGFRLKTLIMMFGIYFMQNTVRDLDAIMGYVAQMFTTSTGINILIVIALSSLFLGLISGLSYLPIGVLMPLIVSLSLPAEQELVYTFFTFTWCFIGYFYSPLHLCQVLTLAQMECPLPKLDRVYIPQMVQMVTTTFVLFGFYWMLLVR